MENVHPSAPSKAAETESSTLEKIVKIALKTQDDALSNKTVICVPANMQTSPATSSPMIVSEQDSETNREMSFTEILQK